MNWGSVSAFFAMGGYAGFVWGSYGVATLCLVIESVLLLARRRSALRDLNRR